MREAGSFASRTPRAARCFPLDYLAKAETLADEFGLAKHLDGARLFNAVVALGVEARDITRHFDTVSICLSKGARRSGGDDALRPA